MVPIYTKYPEGFYIQFRYKTAYASGTDATQWSPWYGGSCNGGKHWWGYKGTDYYVPTRNYTDIHTDFRNYVKESYPGANVKVGKGSYMPYGDIDISINLSKPEKDPKAIAAAKLLPQSGYPKCALCHENEARIWGESPEKCRELLDQLGGRMRAVFDMGNFVLGGYEPYAAYKLLCDHISYFHIKDALARGAIVPAGKGEARIKEILSDFKKLAKTDYFVSLEPHLETFAGLNALTDVAFDNPYKYEDQKAAFTDAVAKLSQILEEIGNESR